MECALYGLKQARREWYNHFLETLLELRFMWCQTEHVVFYCYEDEAVIIVTIDVDNLTMAGSMKSVMASFKQKLSGQYKIKDLGELRWLLGIEVKRLHEEQSITLSQKVYIECILTQFNLQDAKPLSMLVDPQHKLNLSEIPTTPHQLNAMHNVPYQEAHQLTDVYGTGHVSGHCVCCILFIPVYAEPWEITLGKL